MSYMVLHYVRKALISSDSVEVHTRDEDPFSTIVLAWCSVGSPDEYSRGYLLPNYREKIPYPGAAVLRLPGSPIDVRNVWNGSVLAQPERTRFEWMDVTYDESNPVLLALTLRQERDQGPADLTVCAVQSFWTARKQWTTSNGKGLVTNFTWIDGKAVLSSLVASQLFHYSNHTSLKANERWAGLPHRFSKSSPVSWHRT